MFVLACFSAFIRIEIKLFPFGLIMEEKRNEKCNALGVHMRKEHSLSSVETKGIEQKMFNASLRISTIQLHPLVIRYNNGLQTIKIG